MAGGSGARVRPLQDGVAMAGDKYFGDVVYEVWRSGGDPDRVDHDDVDDHRYAGLWLEEAAEVELGRQQSESEIPEDLAFLDLGPSRAEEEHWEQLARDHDEYINRLFWSEHTEYPVRHPMEDAAGAD